MDEVKFRYGQVRAFGEDVEQTRTIEFIISTPSRDRHRTVLSPSNWKLDNFNRNGIVGYQHNVHGGDLCFEPNPDNVIGKAFAFLEGDKLIGRVTFEPAEINPLAEKIFRKVLFGSLSATSVGFLPIGKGRYGTGEEAEGRSNETYYFAGQELLEFSIVNIPSNPDAVGRSIRDQTHNALLFVKRALGEEFSFSDIEKMTVGEVLRQLPKGNKKRELETEELPEHPADIPAIENATEEKQPELVAETLVDESYLTDEQERARALQLLQLKQIKTINNPILA